MSWLSKLFGIAEPPERAPFTAPLTTECDLFVIGDIHGCFDLMQALMAKIERLDAGAPVVFVGDYIDRGEQSAQVLRWLFEQREDPRLTCLMGNHEAMLLDFLDHPAKSGARFLRYGGLQTLASFGLSDVTPGASNKSLEAAAQSLKDEMGPGLISWLRDLPSLKRFGNLAVVHAGANPDKPIALQSTKGLVWGHPAFATTPRQDGIWIAHGHTIVEEPEAKEGRISTDTGAYATGRLTAAYVRVDGSVSFVECFSSSVE